MRPGPFLRVAPPPVFTPLGQDGRQCGTFWGVVGRVARAGLDVGAGLRNNSESECEGEGGPRGESLRHGAKDTGSPMQNGSEKQKEATRWAWRGTANGTDESRGRPKEGTQRAGQFGGSLPKRLLLKDPETPQKVMCGHAT